MITALYSPKHRLPVAPASITVTVTVERPEPTPAERYAAFHSSNQYGR